MSTQAERVKVVQTEFQRLQQYLTAMPADAWATPSACALFSVRDVVAHLIWVAQTCTDGLTRGRQDDTSTPAGGSDPSLFQTRSQEERQQHATVGAQRRIAVSESLGDTLLPVFGHTWDHFAHLAERLSPDEWHKRCYHPRGLMPAHALVNAAVFELAIHGWDIRSVLEPSARLSPEALPVILEFFAECLHWVFAPGARLPTPLRYRFVLTGALHSQWDMVVEGDTAHMARAAEPMPAHVTFGCDGETFALVMCGRIGLDTAMGDKRVIPTGDMAGVQAFKKWFGWV